MTPARRTSRWEAWTRPIGIGAAGLLAGLVLAGSLTASAADSDTSDESSRTTTTAPAQPGGGEEALTGDTAQKVEAAVLGEYPGATIVRLETDSDGVYEAHLMTATGERMTVEVDEDFTVTGAEVPVLPAVGEAQAGPVSPMRRLTTERRAPACRPERVARWTVGRVVVRPPAADNLTPLLRR